MKTIIITILLFTTFVAFGQMTTKKGKNAKACDNHNYFNLMRLGLGVQKSFFTDLGVCRRYSNSYKIEELTTDYYVAVDWTPTAKVEVEKNIYGLKSGLEYKLGGLAIGLEAKCHTDWNNYGFIFTPKIGLGSRNLCVYYGYNVFIDKNQFSKVGRNQFSIAFNFSYSLFPWASKKKK